MRRRDRPYHILGIQPGATVEEIKAAWRTAAKRYHPDVAMGMTSKEAAGKFREATEAYI
ncbi:hypothetical protein LCGC14_3104340, partial [marine sediment metagenome]